MARKTLGYVQLEWTCPRCGNRNPGPHQFCNGCGAAQPEDVVFEQPLQEVLITGEAEIQRAKAGPDVHCPYCQARNPAGAKFCGACGGGLEGGKVRQSGQVLGAHRSEAAPPIRCPACGSENPALALTCAGCGASLAPAKTLPEPAPQVALQPAAKAGARNFIFAGIALLAVFLCIGALVWYMILAARTEEALASVRQVQWTRNVEIEALRPVERRAWRDEIPAEAEIGNCASEKRSVQDEPAPNALEVCGTPYTQDTGGGFGEVVQDCVYEIYADRCVYTVMEWRAVDTLSLSGSDLNPVWPQANLASDQRQGEFNESYTVVFEAGPQSYSYSLSDFSQFTSFQIGSLWLLKVNTFGNVVSVEPAR